MLLPHQQRYRHRYQPGSWLSKHKRPDHSVLPSSVPGGRLCETFCGGATASVSSSSNSSREVLTNHWATTPIVMILVMALPTGIGLDHAGIHCGAFTAHQSGLDAPFQYLLKHKTECFSFPEASEAVFRESRVVRDLVFDAQTAKPAIGQVQFHFFAQTAFRADTQAVTDEQHANRQLQLDRGSSHMAVLWFQVLAKIGEAQETDNAAQQVILRNYIIEIKGEKNGFCGVLLLPIMGKYSVYEKVTD